MTCSRSPSRALFDVKIVWARCAGVYAWEVWGRGASDGDVMAAVVPRRGEPQWSQKAALGRSRWPFSEGRQPLHKSAPLPGSHADTVGSTRKGLRARPCMRLGRLWTGPLRPLIHLSWMPWQYSRPGLVPGVMTVTAMVGSYRPLPDPLEGMSREANATNALRFSTPARLSVCDTLLEGLPQDLQDVAAELRQFIQEEHSVVRERDLARHRDLTPADQPHV
jgi:hypothetical protein